MWEAMTGRYIPSKEGSNKGSEKLGKGYLNGEV